MKTRILADRIGAKMIIGPGGEGIEIEWVYAGDRMSDLLNHVTDTTLLVTNLSHATLMRFIELMDVRAICLLNNAAPADVVLQAAKNHGAAILVSPDGLFETCGRLYRVLIGENQSA